MQIVTMKSDLQRGVATISCLALMLAGCGAGESDPASPAQTDAPSTEVVAQGETDPDRNYTFEDLGITDDPVARSNMIVKVMGSTKREDTHAFLKFHVYGYAGDGNLIPFFSMVNYVVQSWTPGEDGYYSLDHREVGYFAEFDTDTPLDSWENPVTGEVVDLPVFILGPIQREYTPDGIIAPGLAPEPLTISVIGDRVYIPTQSTDKMFNMFTPEEWGVYSSGPAIFWDSMMTYSADMANVLDPAKASAGAEIHMQNFVSWQPYFKMGKRPGRTMVRAYGQHVSGYDALPADVRAHFEEYTPEIFDLENWTELRLDTLEYYNEMVAKKETGELVIEPDEPLPAEPISAEPTTD